MQVFYFFLILFYLFNLRFLWATQPIAPFCVAHSLLTPALVYLIFLKDIHEKRKWLFISGLGWEFFTPFYVCIFLYIKYGLYKGYHCKEVDLTTLRERRVHMA